ncbi:enoyl-CoA hydratase-related protein [Plantactinospora sp. CA-290183]|uniref:enoyl-CoA hydratase-related protein n=1 Tax=Plantactinospora sp. CA-290183 TaxID=3240006 RepID=UPI003D8C7C11
MTSAPAPLVRVSTAHGVTTLTLDSPHNRNALSTPLMIELIAGLAAAVADDVVRVVVLSHTGPVFSSGADLKETAAAYQSGTVPVAMLGDLLTAVWECPKPVVARVGGPARAGGLGLIAAADIAICAQDATFAFTEVRIGVIPAVISATVLPRLHPRAAAELYLTGDTFDGRRAAEIGLVTGVTTAEALDETVASYCAALLRGAPGASVGVKELLRRPPAAGFRADLAELTELSVRYFHSEEGREGVAAFREKRPPRWVSGD